MAKHPNYYLVMRDFGKIGREGVADPELTRGAIIDRIASGELDRIIFIHHVEDGLVEDVTSELIDAAEEILREREAA